MEPAGRSAGDVRQPASVLLPVLVFALPFEPRQPVLALAGLEVTLLEGLALTVLAVLAWSGRAKLRALLRGGHLPLAALAGYAAVHLLSALATPPARRVLALKFALRMLVLLACAVLTAAAPPAARRRALLALVASGAVVAALAVAEGSGATVLDPLLDRFRESRFNVAGVRRATAGSEYPNLAAGFLMCGLVVAAGLAGARRTALGWLLPLAALLGTGLLFTYSRGALVAAALGLLALGGLGARLEGFAGARAAGAVLAVLGLAAAGFAGAREVFRLRLGDESTARWYAAVYEPAERQLALRPGERRLTPVRLSNTGRKAWTRAEAFHLSYHWYDHERRLLADGGRTAFTQDVEPGTSVTLQAEVHAPEREGRYLLVWDMVHEHTTWFSGQGVTPAAVPTTVSLQPAPAEPQAAALAPGPMAWAPARRELWALALGMWRDRPLLGWGPDSFRHLYGPRAARRHWDDRVFANNTLLEAAATTGTLGALALLCTLVLLAAWPARALLARGRLEPVPAALFAAAVAVAAHGTVDYLLAFTGHYLLFGVLVGSAAQVHSEAAA